MVIPLVRHGGSLLHAGGQSWSCRETATRRRIEPTREWPCNEHYEVLRHICDGDESLPAAVLDKAATMITVSWRLRYPCSLSGHFALFPNVSPENKRDSS
jgi:hypothetical protein